MTKSELTNSFAQAKPLLYKNITFMLNTTPKKSLVYKFIQMGHNGMSMPNGEMNFYAYGILESIENKDDKMSLALPVIIDAITYGTVIMQF